MKRKAATYLFFTASVLCCGIFILVHMPPRLINKFLRQPEVVGYDDFRAKGDLYYMCQVNNFSDYVPPATYKFRESEKQSSIDSADIILFGDSFFDHSRYPSVADRLHDSLGLKVHLLRSFDFDESIITKAKVNAVIIVGMVERSVIEFFGPDHTKNSKSISQVKMLTYLFPRDLEKRYLLLSRRSYLTEKTYEAISTFAYNNFGLYNKGVRYDNASGKLYLGDVFQNPKKDPFIPISNYTIDSIATNIQALAKKTFRNHRFIFFPAPNKETLYYSTSKPYNGFLPKLCTNLKDHGVNVVDVYDLFKTKRAEELYFRTDTHWNGDGISLGFSELRKILTTAQ